MDVWIERELADYPATIARMERRAEAVREGGARELLWLLEHPPLYTAGTSAQERELVAPDRFPVYRTRRGGRFTYHGPGQRIAYLVIDLKTRGGDLKRYVHDLEAIVIGTLGTFGIRGERRDDRIGVWHVDEAGVERKIAAIGVRVRRWVAFHGLALNVQPDLAHFGGIVPCGIREYGVTSMRAQGVEPAVEEVDRVLIEQCARVFDRSMHLERAA